MSAIDDTIPLSHAAMSCIGPARGRVPSPLWALSAADRAIALPRRAAERRSQALRPVLSRPAARNTVAAERLFRAVATAAGRDCGLDRFVGGRHAALACSAFAQEATPGYGAIDPFGLSFRRLVVVPGKQTDWRFITTVLHVTHHAAIRFAERSLRTTSEALFDAAREAAAMADVVLLGHLDGPLAARLATGSAAILLPAGSGAFLGFLRLIDGGGAVPVPSIEASTWVHEADLGTWQTEALAFCRAGLPPTEMLRHMPEGFAGVRASIRGDRRIAGGLAVAPLPCRDAAGAWLAVMASPAAASARLRLGLACPDTIAAERRRLGRSR
jgi:hypothetical protein